MHLQFARCLRPSKLHAYSCDAHTACNNLINDHSYWGKQQRTFPFNMNENYFNQLYNLILNPLAQTHSFKRLSDQLAAFASHNSVHFPSNA